EVSAGQARARSDVTHEVPPGSRCVFRGPDHIHSTERRHPPPRVALNLSGALEPIRHHVQTLSTRVSHRPITNPRKMGLASRAGPLALPVQPEMPRTSNNETSDPDEPRYRTTPGSDRSLRRASERVAGAGRDLGAGVQRL